MLLFLAQTLPQAEPPPAGWERGADFAVRKTAEHPDVVFPLLAIAGPVLVGCAFIWASVKYGLPFVKDELAEFRKHTAEMLKQRSDDAAGDMAATRALAAQQHDAIVSRVEGHVVRQTGELQKISDRSERHGELLSKIAAKVGVGLALLLLLAGAVLAGRGARTRELAAGECANAPCATGYHCCGTNLCCADTAPAGAPHSALYANRHVDSQGF